MNKDDFNLSKYLTTGGETLALDLGTYTPASDDNQAAYSSSFSIDWSGRTTSILPQETVTYNLGESSNRWNNVYASRLYAGTGNGNITWNSGQDFHIQMPETSYGIHFGVTDGIWTLRKHSSATTNISLGSPTYKWNTVYATTGTINTSDGNQKKNVEDLSDKYIEMFKLLSPKSFQYIDGDSGRTHIGFIAQDVLDAMNSAGLTSLDFAGFCKDTLEDGTEVYGLRYTEFIAINTAIIQQQQLRLDKLSADIEQIKSKLDL